MNDFYEWLYSNFVRQRMREDILPQSYHAQKKEWQETIEKLPRHEQLLCVDTLSSARESWGLQGFVCGVQVGLLLLDGFLDREEMIEKFIYPEAR